MVDEEIRTYQLSLEQSANGVTASVPWAQRQGGGTIIVRVHLQSAGHTAGELLLNEGDVVALDPDERPLRTQVRRFWGYNNLSAVTPAHLQTARFDAGFRIDLAATGGWCGLAIALVRTFNSGEGPRAVGGPWVFRFRVADDQEIAEVRAEAARQEAARQQAARLEAERQEAQRREAAEREAARQERLQQARAERLAQSELARPPSVEAAPAADEPGSEPIDGARLPRFRRPERGGALGGWGRPPREPLEGPVRQEPSSPVEPRRIAERAPADQGQQAAEAAILGPALVATAATEVPQPQEAAAAEPAGEEEAAPPRRGRARATGGAQRGRRPRAQAAETAENTAAEPASGGAEPAPEPE